MMKLFALAALVLGLSLQTPLAADQAAAETPPAVAESQPAAAATEAEPAEGTAEAAPEAEAEAEKAKPAAADKFHTRRLGDMEIIALLDDSGIRDGSTDILIGAGEADLARAAEKDALKTSINAFVARIHGKTVLFDTGMPIKNSDGILPALKQAGIAPDAVDAVVITHFHFDHVGGLINDGKATYPKAELYLPEMEVNKWSDPGLDFLNHYGVRTNVFKAGAEILPGVTAVAAYGHTPGHTIYRLEAGDGKLLIIGDLVHLPGVQLANPDLAVTYDTDGKRAVSARKQAFNMAIAQELPIAAMHIPFPGLGTLSREGNGYAFAELDK